MIDSFGYTRKRATLLIFGVIRSPGSRHSATALNSTSWGPVPRPSDYLFGTLGLIIAASS